MLKKAARRVLSHVCTQCNVLHMLYATFKPYINICVCVFVGEDCPQCVVKRPAGHPMEEEV